MSTDQPQENSNPLGRQVGYQSDYNPKLLFAIAREEKRIELGLVGELPFVGEDIWNAYELSWLNSSGVPRVATAELRIEANSPNIVESKSLKLYLNSLNQTRFENQQALKSRMESDLKEICQSDVTITIYGVTETAQAGNANARLNQLDALCIDNTPVEISTYQYNPNLLKLTDKASHKLKPQALCSHLLKSNCLITNQPDWASLYINYQGQEIDHAGLLAYIISFRSHNEFHEQCVERIYCDIMQRCRPEKLTVYARYTRRGGLDINPWRSNFEQQMPNLRLVRQ